MSTQEIVFGRLQSPQAVVAWAESKKNKAGIFATTFANQNVYLLAAGPCPSGGYRVEARLFSLQKATVEYWVQGPAADELVIQIVTYPYELVLSSRPLHFIRLDHNRRSVVNPTHESPIK